MIGLLGGLVLGAAIGGGGVWLALRRRLAEAECRHVALRQGLAKLSHDLRGALSPCVLVNERLEASPDPAIRQSSDMLGRALGRMIALATSASAQAKEES